MSIYVDSIRKYYPTLSDIRFMYNESDWTVNVGYAV